MLKWTSKHFPIWRRLVQNLIIVIEVVVAVCSTLGALRLTQVNEGTKEINHGWCCFESWGCMCSHTSENSQGHFRSGQRGHWIRLCFINTERSKHYSRFFSARFPRTPRLKKKGHFKAGNTSIEPRHSFIQEPTFWAGGRLTSPLR